MKLYQIAEEILALEAIIDDAGDQADESLHAALDSLGMDAQAKVDNLHKWHRQLSAEAYIFEEEADRLQSIANAKYKKAESIKRYVFAMVQILGGKVETTIGPVRIQSNGGRQPLILTDDIGVVPPEYIIQEPKVDKDKLRADIEAAQALMNANDEQGQDAANFLQELEQRGIVLAERGKSLRGI